MTLIVEDGTGVYGAESYGSVADADIYWGNRTHTGFYTTWNAAAVAAKEGAAREASDYLDAEYGRFYLGIRAGDAQGRDWPRTGAVDAQGRPVPNLPPEIIKATFELSARAIVARLDKDKARGGMIESVGAGPARVTFSKDAPSKITYGLILGILEPILNGQQINRATWQWR